MTAFLTHWTRWGKRLSASDGGLYVVDAQRRMVVASPAVGRWLGIDAAALVGQECRYHGGNDSSDLASLATRALRPEEIHLYASDNHHLDFFDCVRTRRHPIADVEVGHRLRRVEALAVEGREPAAPRPRRGPALGLAQPLLQCGAEAVAPRRRRLGQPVLEQREVAVPENGTTSLELPFAPRELGREVYTLRLTVTDSKGNSTSKVIQIEYVGP